VSSSPTLLGGMDISKKPRLGGDEQFPQKLGGDRKVGGAGKCWGGMDDFSNLTIENLHFFLKKKLKNFACGRLP